MTKTSIRTQVQYKVTQTSEDDSRILNLTHVRTAQEEIITVEETDDGQVLYTGLPEELRELLVNYSNEELL